jgi:hypothetical protein
VAFNCLQRKAGEKKIVIGDGGWKKVVEASGKVCYTQSYLMKRFQMGRSYISGVGMRATHKDITQGIKVKPTDARRCVARAK